MASNLLLDQAEDYLARYHSEGGQIYNVLRPLIDGARANNIAEDVRSSATELQNRDPYATISLLIERILQGGTEKIDGWDLQRRIAALDSEKGPNHFSRSFPSIADYDPTAPGIYTLNLEGKDYQLIVEQTSYGFRAHVPGFPECATRAPTAIEALSKTHTKLWDRLRSQPSS